MKKKINETNRILQERGITLVALVITIVIIIILATVTINFLFGEGGIITKAEEARKMSNIESTREQLEIAKASEIAEGQGKVDIDDYFDNLENAGIIGSVDGSVEDKGDGSYEITTDDGFIFEVTPIPDKDNADDILIDYVGEAIGPRIKEIKGTTTTNSATIEVIAENAENATYKYEYKKQGESDWITVEGQEESICTIEGLEDGEIYNIRVTVVASNGTRTRQTSIKTGQVQGKITFETPVWQGDGTASIVANTNETGYTMQYQIKPTDGTEPDEDAWEPVAENGIITGIEHNETVFVRLWDGNNGSNYASTEIKDEIVPKDATISLSSTSVTTGTTVRATVTHNDSESGPEITQCKYVWNTSSSKIGTDESLYTGGTFSSNGEQISRTMSSAGNYYLHVLTVDKAGNKWETVSDSINVYVQKYYRWKQYSVINNSYYSMRIVSTTEYNMQGTFGINYWTSYTFNNKSGLFAGSGSYIGNYVEYDDYSLFYGIRSNKEMYRYVRKNMQCETSETSPNIWHVEQTNYEPLYNSSYSKGSYISTVSSLSSTAYPNNGRSGSYWYVYDGYY